MLSRAAFPWRWATAALLILLLGISLKTFSDYGMSWDEFYRNTEGAKKFAYYENAFSGHWQPYDNPEDNYPGFYDLVHQLLFKTGLFGPGSLGMVYSDHLLSAVFGILTVFGAYKVGKQLGGARTGFLSAFFLTLFPHFYGHMFINPKDIPFACMYIWSLYQTIKVISIPKITPGFIAILTLTYGLTLGVRMGGAFFFAFMALAFAVRLWLKRRDDLPWSRAVHYAGMMTTVVLGAFVILLPWWPFAHQNPLTAIVHTLMRIGEYPWNGPVVLNGRVYPATHLPWFYMPEMLSITTPIFLIAIGILGGIIGLWSLVFIKSDRRAVLNRLSIGLVAFCFLFPIVVVAIKHATLYDGIRHFLFVLGPWAVLNALAVGTVFDWISSLKSPSILTRILLGLPVGILLIMCATFVMERAVLWPLFYRGYMDGFLISAFVVALIGLFVLIRFHLRTSLICLILFGSLLVVREDFLLHPYQYIFFNSLVGGEEKAYADFDTDYWGTSHREAVEMLVAHLKKTHDTRIYKVTSPMAPWLVEIFLPANLVYTYDPREADFFISFLRYNAHMWSDGTVMEDCIVMRNNTPLALVRDRRKIISQQAQLKGRANQRLVSSLIEMLQPIF
jgi:4-amino-4-deoxy-L-arabinose transferase-like glycosyltransferase